MREFLFHRTVHFISQTLYQICRFCAFGYFAYNEETEKLYICQHTALRKYITCSIKIVLLLFDYVNYVYMLADICAHMFGNISEKSAGYNFYLETSIYGNVNYQCLRMIYLLHSWHNSGAYVIVINQIMELHRNMCSTFDRSNFTLEHNILIISVVEFGLTLLQIWNQMMTSYILLVFVYHLVLFELFYWAYFLYQLILIAWHQILLNLLSSYAGKLRPNKRQRHRLMLFYGFYFRMCAIHGNITQHWLKIAGGLFASIAILSVDISEELYNIIYKQESPLQKWKYFVIYKIGNCLAPIVKIFLLGLCNNRIEKLTKLLAQQIYLIELLHWKRSLDKLPSTKRKPFTSLLASKFNCFVLQQHTRPIRNHIWHAGQTINIEFLLLFIWLAFLNAMSTLQYELTKKSTYLTEHN